MFKSLKTKVLGLLGLFAVGATQSFGAVAYDTATNSFTGSIDTGAYTSAIVIAVGVISLVIAVSLGIRALKSSKNA